MRRGYSDRGAYLGGGKILKESHGRLAVAPQAESYNRSELVIEKKSSEDPLVLVMREGTKLFRSESSNWVGND